MSGRNYSVRVDDVDDRFVELCINDDAFAWFLMDEVNFKQVNNICFVLNSKEKRISELENLLENISKSILYACDTEKSYGDEYTSIILNDIIDKFNLKEII